MRFSSKAVVNIEFMVSIVIFLAIISFVVINTFNLLPTFHSETLYESVKSNLYMVSEKILDQGYPNDWNKDAANVKRFGLSTQERHVLDANKVEILNSVCKADYNRVRSSLSDYNIGISVERLNGEQLIRCQPPVKQLSTELYIDRFAVLREPIKTDNGTLMLLHFDNNYTDVNGISPSQQTGTSFAAGRFNSSVFIGSGGILSYPSAGSISQTEGTIELWVRPDWNGDASSMLNHYFFDFRPEWHAMPYDQNTFRIGYFGTSNETLGFRIADMYGTYFTIYSMINNWNAGQWHHIAATWKNVNSNQPNAETHFYLDGKDVGSIRNVSIPLNETANNIFIGSVRGSDRFADASIDDLRISSRLRTSDEIATDYFGDIVRVRVSVYE